MTPDVVVDIGNSRIKWGLCDEGGISVVAARPHAESPDASDILVEFGLAGPVRWAVAGVQPVRLAAFVAWATGRGDDVVVVDRHDRLPLTVAVDFPERVGIDRLLAAVAVNRRRTPGAPVIFADAGSAITVNFVDANGVFQGGSIAPGLGLMSRALNAYTAKLPLVSPEPLLALNPKFPAGTTTAAILCGLRAAAVGGTRELVSQVMATGARPELFVTGGDGWLLADGLADLNPRYVSSLTLEGIRLAAEALP